MNPFAALPRLFARAPAPDSSHDLLASLLVMAWMVEARDPYTGGHLWRVARLSALLAERAELAQAQVARVALGGFLHDLGKIAVPDAILRKPERLTDEEFAVIRTHPEVGGRLLEGHPLGLLVRDAVTRHHDRPDGLGYPHRADMPIPLDARIVGICDAFDAMTSSRPYRPGMPIAEALSRIRSGLGTQFDEELGEAFLSLADTALLPHIVGHSDDGIPLQTCMMCGPTLVTTRETAPGDRIYCRSCAGEYEIARDEDGALAARPTGGAGGPDELAPATDLGLIHRFVRETVERMPRELLAHAAPT